MRFLLHHSNQWVQGSGAEGCCSLCYVRLARIREVSGSQVAERMLAEVLGKGDLDLAEYDRAMEAAFGNSYYEVRSLHNPLHQA